jgi:hypothetical protein
VSQGVLHRAHATLAIDLGRFSGSIEVALPDLSVFSDQRAPLLFGDQEAPLSEKVEPEPMAMARTQRWSSSAALTIESRSRGSLSIQLSLESRRWKVVEVEEEVEALASGIDFTREKCHFSSPDHAQTRVKRRPGR